MVFGRAKKMESNSKKEIWIKDWPRFINRLFLDAEPYLSVRGDMPHAKVSHGYAIVLMKEEGGDQRIIEPAIILHDVGWSRLERQAISAAYGVRAKGSEWRNLNRVHEEAGEAIAREILEGYSYDPSLIETIASIIRAHDSGEEARSIEEAVVKDADKLWRFSEIGFSVETRRQGISPMELYQHLENNRESWFFTRTGLRLAEKELQRRKYLLKPQKDHYPTI